MRGLGPAAATSVVVGSVIGTGIFLKTRVMMCNVDTPWLVIAAWVLAGGLSIGGRAHLRRTGRDDATGRRRVRVHPRRLRAAAGLSLRLDAVRRGLFGSQAAKGIGFAIFLNSLVGGALDRTLFTLDFFGSPVPFGLVQAVALIVIVAATLVNCLAVSTGGSIAVFLTTLKIGDRGGGRRRRVSAGARGMGAFRHERGRRRV